MHVCFSSMLVMNILARYVFHKHRRLEIYDFENLTL